MGFSDYFSEEELSGSRFNGSSNTADSLRTSIENDLKKEGFFANDLQISARPIQEAPDPRDLVRKEQYKESAAFRESASGQKMDDLLSNQEDLISGAKNDRGFVANVINAFKVGAVDTGLSSLLGKNQDDPIARKEIYEAGVQFKQKVAESFASGEEPGAIEKAFYDAAGSAHYTIQNMIAGTLAQAANLGIKSVINKSALGSVANRTIFEGAAKLAGKEGLEELIGRALVKRAAALGVAAAEPTIIGEAVVAGLLITDVIRMIRATSKGEQFGGGISVPGVVAGFNRDFSAGNTISAFMDAGIPNEFLSTQHGQQIVNSAANVYSAIEAFNVVSLVTGPMSAVSSLANRAIARSTVSASVGIAARFASKYLGGVAVESAEEGSQDVSQKIYLDKAVKAVLESDPNGMVYGAMLDNLRNQPPSDVGEMLKLFAESSVKAVPSMMVLGLFGAPGSLNSSMKEYGQATAEKAQKMAKENQAASEEERVQKLSGMRTFLSEIESRNSDKPMKDWTDEDLQNHEAALKTVYSLESDPEAKEEVVKQLQSIQDEKTIAVFTRVLSEMYGTAEAAKIVTGQLETEAEVKEILSDVRKKAVSMGIEPSLVSEAAFNSAIRKDSAFSIEETVKRTAASEEYAVLKKIITAEGFEPTRKSIQKIREMLIGRVIQVGDGEFLEVTKDTPNQEVVDAVIKRVAYIEERVGAFDEAKKNPPVAGQGVAKPLSKKEQAASDKAAAIEFSVATVKASVGDRATDSQIEDAYGELPIEQKKVFSKEEFSQAFKGKNISVETIAPSGTKFEASEIITNHGMTKKEIESLLRSNRDGAITDKETREILKGHIRKRAEISGVAAPSNLDAMNVKSLSDTAAQFQVDSRSRMSEAKKAKAANAEADLKKSEDEKNDAFYTKLTLLSPEDRASIQAERDSGKTVAEVYEKVMAMPNAPATPITPITPAVPASEASLVGVPLTSELEESYRADAKRLGLRYDGTMEVEGGVIPQFTDEKNGASFYPENGETTESAYERIKKRFKEDYESSPVNPTSPGAAYSGPKLAENLKKVSGQVKDDDFIVPESGFKTDGKVLSAVDILQKASELTNTSLADLQKREDGTLHKAFTPKEGDIQNAYAKDGMIITSVPSEFFYNGELAKGVRARWVYVTSYVYGLNESGGNVRRPAIALQLVKESTTGANTFYNVAIGFEKNEAGLSIELQSPIPGFVNRTNLGFVNKDAFTGIDLSGLRSVLATSIDKAGIGPNGTKGDEVKRLPGAGSAKLQASFATKTMAAEEWREAVSTLPQFEYANGKITFSGSRGLLKPEAQKLLDSKTVRTEKAMLSAIKKLNGIYKIPEIVKTENGYELAVNKETLIDQFSGTMSLGDMATSVVFSERKNPLFRVFESMFGTGEAERKGGKKVNLNAESFLAQIIKEDVLKTGGKSTGTILLDFLSAEGDTPNRAKIWKELTGRISEHMARTLEEQMGNSEARRIVEKIGSVTEKERKSVAENILSVLNSESAFSPSRVLVGEKLKTVEAARAAAKVYNETNGYRPGQPGSVSYRLISGSVSAKGGVKKTEYGLFRYEGDSGRAKELLGMIVSTAVRKYGMLKNDLEAFTGTNVDARKNTALYKAVLNSVDLLRGTYPEIIGKAESLFGVSGVVEQNLVEKKKAAASGRSGVAKFADVPVLPNSDPFSRPDETALQMHRRLAREYDPAKFSVRSNLLPMVIRQDGGTYREPEIDSGAFNLMMAYVRERGQDFPNVTDDQFRAAATIYAANRALARSDLAEKGRGLTTEQKAELKAIIKDAKGAAGSNGGLIADVGNVIDEMQNNAAMIAAEKRIAMTVVAGLLDPQGPYSKEFTGLGIDKRMAESKIGDPSANIIYAEDAMAEQALQTVQKLASSAETDFRFAEEELNEAGEFGNISLDDVEKYEKVSLLLENSENFVQDLAQAMGFDLTNKRAFAEVYLSIKELVERNKVDVSISFEEKMNQIKEAAGDAISNPNRPAPSVGTQAAVVETKPMEAGYDTAEEAMAGLERFLESSRIQNVVIKKALAGIEGSVTVEKINARLAVLAGQISSGRAEADAARAELSSLRERFSAEKSVKARALIGGELNRKEKSLIAISTAHSVLKNEVADLRALGRSFKPGTTADGRYVIDGVGRHVLSTRSEKAWQDAKPSVEMGSAEYKKSVESTLKRMGMPFSVVGDQYVVTAPNGAKFTISRTNRLFDERTKTQKAGVTIFSEQAAIQIATFGSDHTTLPHELAEYVFRNILTQDQRNIIAKAYGITNEVEAGHKWAAGVEDMDLSKHSPKATGVLAQVVNLFRALLGFSPKGGRQIAREAEEVKKLSRMFISGQLTQSAEARTGRSRVVPPSIEQVRAMSDLELDLRVGELNAFAKANGVETSVEEGDRRTSRERFVSGAGQIYHAAAVAKMARDKDGAQFLRLYSGKLGGLLDGMTYLETVADFDSTGVVRTIVDDFKSARENDSAMLKHRYRIMVLPLGNEIDKKLAVVIDGKSFKLSADQILSLKAAWGDEHVRDSLKNENVDIDLSPGAGWKHSVKVRFSEQDFLNLPAIKGETEFLSSLNNSTDASGVDLAETYNAVIAMGGGLGIRPDDKPLKIVKNYYQADWDIPGRGISAPTSMDRGLAGVLKERSEGPIKKGTLRIHPISEVINGHTNFVSDFVGSARQTIALRHMLSGTDRKTYGVGEFETLRDTLYANKQKDISSALTNRLHKLFENIEGSLPSQGDPSSYRTVKALLARQDIYRLSRPTTFLKMAGSVLIAPVYMKDANNLRLAMTSAMPGFLSREYENNPFQRERAQLGVQPWLSGTASEAQGRVNLRGKPTWIERMRGVAATADQLAMKTIFHAAAFEMLPDEMPRTNASIGKMAGDEVYLARVREHANMLTAKTQSSSLPELRGEIYNNKNIFMKMMTRYGTQQNRILNMVVTEYYRAKTNPTAESVARFGRSLNYGMALNSIVMASIGVSGKAFSELVKTMIGGEDDDKMLYESELKRRKESKLLQVGKETAYNMATMVEGMDEAWAAVSALKAAIAGDKSADYMANRALMGRFVGSEAKAILDMSKSLAEMRRITEKEQEEGSISDSDAKWYAFNVEKAQKSFITSVSFFIGLPVAGVEQVVNTSRSARKVAFGSKLDSMY